MNRNTYFIFSNYYYNNYINKIFEQCENNNINNINENININKNSYIYKILELTDEILKKI